MTSKHIGYEKGTRQNTTIHIHVYHRAIQKLRVLKGTKNTKIAEKLISVLREAETRCRYVIFPQRTGRPHIVTQKETTFFQEKYLKIFSIPILQKLYLSNGFPLREGGFWIKYHFDIWKSNFGSQTIEEWFKENIKAFSSAENPFDLIHFRLKLKYTFGRSPFSLEFS